MSEVLERVARIVDPPGWDWYDKASPMLKARERFYEVAIERARRVVLELAEPTEAMQAAGRGVLLGWLPGSLVAGVPMDQDRLVIDVWKTMVWAGAAKI